MREMNALCFAHVQIGTPLRILRQATNCERNHVIESDEDMEKEIFSRLPDNIHSFSWTRDRKDVVGGTHVHFAEDASTGIGAPCSVPGFCHVLGDSTDEYIILSFAIAFLSQSG